MNYSDHIKINYWYKDTTIDCCKFKLKDNNNKLELDNELPSDFIDLLNNININNNNLSITKKKLNNNNLSITKKK
jgi:hypothetical protein